VKAILRVRKDISTRSGKIKYLKKKKFYCPKEDAGENGGEGGTPDQQSKFTQA